MELQLRSIRNLTAFLTAFGLTLTLAGVSTPAAAGGNAYEAADGFLEVHGRYNRYGYGRRYNRGYGRYGYNRYGRGYRRYSPFRFSYRPYYRNRYYRYGY